LKGFAPLLPGSVGVIGGCTGPMGFMRTLEALLSAAHVLSSPVHGSGFWRFRVAACFFNFP
jgi:hypothetical protein